LLAETGDIPGFFFCESKQWKFMRIGVVSDTHNNLSNCKRIVELFNNADVDHVVHTGDITQAKTIDVLANLRMPVTGVFGNNDLERGTLDAAMARHGFRFIEPPLTLHWADRRLTVVHDPLDLHALDLGNVDVVLHGHTHRQVIEFSDNRLTFNPGECAGMMKGLNAIGILDLVGMDTEILNF
jgi:uncharacterized protein